MNSQKPHMAICAALLLAGCQNVVDPFIVDAAVVDTKGALKTAGERPTPVPLGEVMVGNKPAYAEAIAAADGVAAEPQNKGRLTTAKLRRNELQGRVMELSDRVCEFHKGAIIANSAAFSFGTSLTATILSTISAAVGANVAKTALSTAAAASSATGTAIKAEFYQNLFATAIVRKINDLRDQKRAAIEGKQSADVPNYSVPMALRDADEYHAKCSFFVGLVALTDDGKKVETLTSEQITSQIEKLTAENTELLPKFSNANATATSSEEREAARRSFSFNAARIDQLRAMRLSVAQQMAPTK